MVNAYEAGHRRVIPAVLVYARHGEDVLMVERAGRPGDVHAGKFNGLGGKAEPDESAAETAAREFHEEAQVALPPARFRPLGVLLFPLFKAARAEDWLVHVFTADLLADERARVPAANVEGRLHWVPASRLVALNLWEGDRHFLPHVLARQPFCGTFWYRDGRLERHTLRLLG